MSLENRVVQLEKELGRLRLWAGFFCVIIAAIALAGLMLR